MKSFATLATFTALVAQAYAAINTPTNLVQCQPSLLTWDATSGPYFLTIFPGGQTSNALKTFDSTNATSITWVVDIAQGTSITLGLRDSTGQQFFSDAVTIASSSDNSCVNSDQTVSVTSTNAGGSSSSGGSGTTSGSGTSATSTRASTSGGSGSQTASNSASSESSTGGAERLNVAGAAGLAGVLGLVGAALF